ncbi:Follistatin-related protein 1 [Pteropus alecto]|uniref:Follistatin-related protein 1 n=1 Tax=Pteropus alecto TaxID=9402 RepID=L5L358_PTEAL|nr:Follistatin-related protein 1 [Pteropus alecto]
MNGNWVGRVLKSLGEGKLESQALPGEPKGDEHHLPLMFLWKTSHGPITVPAIFADFITASATPVGWDAEAGGDGLLSQSGRVAEGIKFSFIQPPLLLSQGANEEELRSKSKICANVFCGAGRECAVTEKGEPTCLCIEQCKPHKRPVCGSNGKTYLNHCELHRDACLTGSKIQVDYDGHCKEKKSVSPSASPVVCYQSNRDELRRRIIQWLEAEIIPDGWFSKGSNYSEILDKYFKNFDNGDSRLDSSEFLKFVEQNETAINITTYADQENNKLLRGLCVDALIELSDENADWKLSFQEFLQCLNPSFNPPEKKCALEDETYADGAETEVECNRCVCACGNWVCTAMTCDGKNQKGAQTQREEEMTRYVQELQKHQVQSEMHLLSKCLGEHNSTP